MKRQSIITFFQPKSKQKRNDEQVSRTSSSTASAVTKVGINVDQSEVLQVEKQVSTSTVSSPASAVTVSIGKSEVVVEKAYDLELPDCWNVIQYDHFKQKYDGLEVKNSKLGCNHCANAVLNTTRIHLSKEWQRFLVKPSGKTRNVRQGSLRRKMYEHFSSKAHNIAAAQSETRQTESLPTCVDNLTLQLNATTCAVFNSVYFLAKKCRPFSDIEDLVQLQQKNGVDLGHGLHSRTTATKITAHIAEEIKWKFFGNVIKHTSKVCLIIDEASTISNKSVVVIFIKIERPKFSPTQFVDLIELDRQDADTIQSAVLKGLSDVGLSLEYLKKNLIGICTDGASVMLGRKSGVATRFKEKFPNIIVWHCLNHRLQLALDDAVNEIKHVNHFKIFLDKIYSIFHQSNKEQTRLFEASEDLGIQITKIGRVLGPRWAACSLRAVIAVWRAYPALHKVFKGEKKFSGLATRLENKNFIKDLALMIDILTEIANLSVALEARGVGLERAERLIKRTLKAFRTLKSTQGCYEQKVERAVSSEDYRDIKFVENLKFVCLPRDKLIDALMTNLEKRLLSYDNLTSTSVSQNNQDPVQLFDTINLIQPHTWKIEEIEVPWFAAEQKLEIFEQIFQHEILVNDYRDFVENVIENFQNPVVPASVLKAQNIVNTMAVSSAEAERGFSLMNTIMSTRRSRLIISNVSNIMTIAMIGKQFKDWDPTPFVQSWLRKHNSADDTRVKHKVPIMYTDNERSTWELLE